MKKKTISTVIISIAMATMLTACGGGNSDSANSVSETVATSTDLVEETTEKLSTETTDEVEETEAPSTEETEAPTEAPSTEETEAPTEETTKPTTETAAPSTETTKPSTESTKPSTEASSTPQPTATHTHTWVPVTTTVHHDAVTHVEEETLYREEIVSVYHEEEGHFLTWCCTHQRPLKECLALYEAGDRAAAADCSYFTDWIVDTPAYYTYETQQVPYTQSKTVVDQAAYDETVVTGYKCECGATK